MAGTLTIYAAEGVGTPGDTFSGHCWIGYEPETGAPITYGTWGNNPDGLRTGLLEKLSPGRAGVAQRSVYLDDLQEARLISWIQQYLDKRQSESRSQDRSPDFVSKTWYTATGEKMSGGGGEMNSSSYLKDSIERANAKGAAVAVPGESKAPGLADSLRRRRGLTLSPGR
jgi:hypothetical protein